MSYVKGIEEEDSGMEDPFGLLELERLWDELMQEAGRNLADRWEQEIQERECCLYKP